MKLYFSAVTCALSPYIVMLEAGLPHELVPVSLKTHTLPNGSDYFRINPLGYVPLLELDDGRQLSEGVAIIQYLADQAPGRQLAPANGTFERYQLQSRLNFIATELPKNFDVLFSSDATPEARQKATQVLQRHYAYVEGILARQDYFSGPQFSIADAYLFTVTGWATRVQLDLSAFPAVQGYMARIAERPAVQTALKAEKAQPASCG